MKNLSSDSYVIRPFVTHKTQTLAYVHSGSVSSGLSIDIAEMPPTNVWTFIQNTEPQNSGSGLYNRTLYASVRHLFYSSHSLWNGSPTEKQFDPTGSSFYVMGIGQAKIGEGIYPSSFSMTTANGTGSYIDLDGRIVWSQNTSSVVGNIFYTLGLVVINKFTGSFSGSVLTSRGMFLGSGSSVTTEFKSTRTIYEHRMICTLEPGEFNFSSNPSIKLSPSSSVSGNIRTMDLISSGTLKPYMTTVGFYNDNQELLAVAKFPHPVKRAINTQQTIVVKFDI